MADDDVRPRLGHRGGVILIEHVGRGEQVLLMGLGDHVDLQAEAHPGLLEVGAEHAVDEADRREVLHPGEARTLELVEKV